jgi:hypothetical protein
MTNKPAKDISASIKQPQAAIAVKVWNAGKGWSPRA